MSKTPHASRSSTQELIAQEAVEWICELQASPSDRQVEFLAWLKRSPQHVEEFLIASAIWSELDSVPAFDRSSIDALIEEARASAGANIVSLHAMDTRPSTTSSRKPTNRWRRRTAIAATSAAIMIGWLSWLYVDPARTYSTHLGEQRAIRLEDGSVLHLNTRSKVRVRFTDEQRAVNLIEGQALFTVEKDPSRPFRVSAGDTLIEAVGTQFDVYRRASGTVVSVIEGIVKIEPVVKSGEGPDLPSGEIAAPHIKAGEQAQVARDGTVEKRMEPELTTLIAWRERRLVFRGETLREVADEFNRYLPKPIQIETESARNRRIAGTFNADDPESFLLFIEQYGDLTVTQTESGYRIRSTENK